MTDQPLMTRQRYLFVKAVQSGAVMTFVTNEAVATTALAHPEWDMDEQHTYDEWEAMT